jgi:hypothetical protein
MFWAHVGCHLFEAIFLTKRASNLFPDILGWLGKWALASYRRTTLSLKYNDDISWLI